MAATSYLDPSEEGAARTPPRAIVLAVCMTIILSGALYTMSYFVRSATWLIWAIIYYALFRFRHELSLRRLIMPAMPYLAWLYFYLIWALIVAPQPDVPFALKVAITTTTLGVSMAALTAKPAYLRVFATYAQFAIILNLVLLWPLLHMPRIAALIMAANGSTEGFAMGTAIRYGGIWGNPNMVGYMCLVATILSVLAVPWVAWAGRLSCLPLLYICASRKSMIMFFTIIFLYLVIVKRREFKFWLIAFMLVFSGGITLILADGLRAQSKQANENPIIARLMDVEEKDTAMRGGETRVDLVHHWVTIINDEPWYGYGLHAMAGTLYDENDPEKVLFQGHFPLGTHNTYLGVWVETGLVGLLFFLAVMGHYLRKCLFSGGDPITKWVLTSLVLVNLVFLLVSHNHLFCFEGKITYTLLFLLPSCVGLRALGQRLSYPP